MFRSLNRGAKRKVKTCYDVERTPPTNQIHQTLLFYSSISQRVVLLSTTTSKVQLLSTTTRKINDHEKSCSIATNNGSSFKRLQHHNPRYRIVLWFQSIFDWRIFCVERQVNCCVSCPPWCLSSTRCPVPVSSIFCF